MRKLLWVGDAACATGFARATHYTLDVLQQSWDVHVLGLNYMGDPHQYPYPIYPAMLGGDIYGIGRIARLVKALEIDCVVLQNDVWNIPVYLEALKFAKLNVPVIGALAVDGKNCQGWKLNDLTLAIFWTQFAEEEARRGGFTGKSVIVPLGVDREIYYPVDQTHARSLLEFHPKAKSHPPSDGFFVGNVNRNQVRKRLDLTIEYFCHWVKWCQVQDAYLFIHACPTGEEEFDVEQLMEYYGMRDRLVFIQPNIGQGVPEEQLRWTYNLFDVQVNTGQGEGMGLTTLEGMACGIPQVVGQWAALGDVCIDSAVMIPCSRTAATQNRINAIGGVPDKHEFVLALNNLYKDKALRETYRAKGLALISEPRFRWENIGQTFGDAMDSVLVAEAVA